MTETKEQITTQVGYPDDWICVCGNTSMDDGFFPYDEKGEQIEPYIG